MTINIRPINNDVLLKMVRPRVSESVIYVEPQTDETQKVFEVLAISDKVKHVSVGDMVVVPWTRITNPFTVDIDGEPVKVGITDEKELLAVLGE
jgi:co-chaperonin GroES (HSP10)